MNYAEIKQQFLLHAPNPAQAEMLINTFRVLINRMSAEVVEQVANAIASAPADITTREQAFEYAMTQLRECMRPIE